MEKQIQINIKSFRVIVHPVELEKIKAFVEIYFIDSEGKPIFKIRGCTVKLKDFSGQIKLSVDFPAYISKGEYRTAFYIDNLTLWRLITDTILNEYSETTGEKITENNEGDNDIDIPF